MVPTQNHGTDNFHAKMNKKAYTKQYDSQFHIHLYLLKYAFKSLCYQRYVFVTLQCHLELKVV